MTERTSADTPSRSPLPRGRRRGSLRRVVVAGTFDGLHEGHREYFRQAKRHGDVLIAIVARDATVEKLKGHRPQLLEGARLQAVAAEPLVDEAVLGRAGGDRFAILKELRPDVVFLGYDQPASEEELRARLREYGLEKTEVLRGSPFRPEIYKSSKMRDEG